MSDTTSELPEPAATIGTPPPDPAGLPPSDPAGVSNGRAVAAGAVIVALSAGWFLMSHFAMDTDVSDALGEAVGVALGLLLVISVVGAAVSGRRKG